jgi:hypothetical protein
MKAIIAKHPAKKETILDIFKDTVVKSELEISAKTSLHKIINKKINSEYNIKT